MKLLITESKLKNLIKYELGTDFSNNVKLIDDIYEIPFEIEQYLGEGLGHRLRLNGPFILVTSVLNPNNSMLIIHNRNNNYTYYYLVYLNNVFEPNFKNILKPEKVLGLDHILFSLNVTLYEFLNIYLPEEYKLPKK